MCLVKTNGDTKLSKVADSCNLLEALHLNTSLSNSNYRTKTRKLNGRHLEIYIKGKLYDIGISLYRISIGVIHCTVPRCSFASQMW